MKIVQIPKRGGGVRRIYVCRGKRAEYLRGLMRQLRKIEDVFASDAVHGFRPHRSPVTAAQRHIGFAWTLCMDLADWYDSITPQQIAYATRLWETRQAVLGKKFSQRKADDLAENVCVDGAPRQGLPTSPIAANLAAIPFDDFIIAKLPPGIVYTRYADDLAFSGNDHAALLHVRDEVVPAAAAMMNWRIKSSKTRLMDARYGRRTICGIAVGEADLSVPRRFKRRLRAQKHNPQHNWRRVRGKEAWIAHVEKRSVAATSI